MDYSDNSLRASIRALETVVAPVVAESGDAQAEDQLGLVLDALRFLELRLSDLPSRAAFAARNGTRLAQELAALFPEDPALGESLRAVMREEAATGAVRDLIRRWPSFSEERRRLIARIVLESERRRVEADRAWFAPMGFDPVPDSIISLEEAWS